MSLVIAAAAFGGVIGTAAVRICLVLAYVVGTVSVVTSPSVSGQRKASKIWRGTAAGFVLVVLLFGFDRWIEGHRERPHVAATLVIDGVNGKGEASFHFEVRNISASAVTLSRVFVTTPDVSDAKLEPPPGGWFVAPNGGVLNIPTPAQAVLKSETQKVDLSMFYAAPAGSDLSSSFGFLIQPSDVRAQTVTPTFAAEADGAVIDQDAGMTRLLSAMSQQSQGSLFFVFPEMAKGEANVIRLSDTRKNLVVDPASRNIVWRVTLDSGQTISITGFLQQSAKGLHSVAVTWDYSHGATLYIDGMEIKPRS